MPFLVPKHSAEAAVKKKKTDNLPNYTEQQLDIILDPKRVAQELAEMLRKGLAPSQCTGATEVLSDVTEIVRWLDSKNEDLKVRSRGTPDPEQNDAWVADLLEDMVAFGVSPANSPEETLVIVKGLSEELKMFAESGYGPEARNYLAQMTRELDLLVEKLEKEV